MCVDNAAQRIFLLLPRLSNEIMWLQLPTKHDSFTIPRGNPPDIKHSDLKMSSFQAQYVTIVNAAKRVRVKAFNRNTGFNGNNQSWRWESSVERDKLVTKLPPMKRNFSDLVINTPARKLKGTFS